MKILVVGAGMVGSSIARSLADTHEVTVMDLDASRVDDLTYGVDVLALQGDGTDLADLQEAGADQAELVIASTDVDETNLAVSGTVKAMGDPFTIARVKRRSYLDTWQRSQGVFGVDFMVCTDLLTAQAVGRVIGLPTATDMDSFANGTIQMAEFEVREDSPVANQTVRDADTYEGLTFAGIITDGEVEIARGSSIIPGGSRIVVIGNPAAVRSFGGAVSQQETDGASDVVIFGGTSVGSMVAELLEKRGIRPRLIEADPEVARSAAERLPGTTVMQHDVTDLEFMKQEDVGGADLVVAALDSDEANLLVSLLAGSLGAVRTIAIVEDQAYVDTFETVGVDVAVNPREVTAEEVTRFTRERRAENVAIIQSDQAEVVEILIKEGSVLAGRRIADAAADLPDDVVIGALTRGEESLLPRGDTVVEVGDHIVVFVASDHIDEAITAL